MIRRLEKLSVIQTNILLDGLLKFVSPHLTDFNGRKRCWLEWEFRYHSEPQLLPALKCSPIWDFCKMVYPKAELGLVNYGGVDLKGHRDHYEFSAEACAINLGLCDWVMPDESTRSLECGEVILFDAHQKHGSLNCSIDRWAIALWSMGEKWRSNRES